MYSVQRLLSAGFDRVIVLNGAECGVPEAGSILLALWAYEAEAVPASSGAWIHPYYFASQRAYTAASAIAAECASHGLALRDDIRVKPIFARLPGFSQGRNTLSYVEGFGSRFHVQIFTLTPAIPPTHHLTEEPHPLHCGNCRKCVAACPTNALEDGLFHRERCLRNWQLGGQPLPEALRSAMGNRLIGCDVCQQVCPHNPKPEGEAHEPVSLETLLSTPKQAAQTLKSAIGANLAIPNRVLAQALIIAGNSGRIDLLEQVEKLRDHSSPLVSEHAEWAAAQIRVKHL